MGTMEQQFNSKESSFNSFSRSLEWPYPSKLVCCPSSFGTNKMTMSEQYAFLHYLIITTDTRHKHLPAISRVFGKWTELGKLLNLTVRVAWVKEECDQQHTHTVPLLTEVIYTAMPEIAETSHGKHREEVSVSHRISSLPQLVMSVHSISTNRHVTVIIIKWNSLYIPHILRNSFGNICWERQNKPVQGNMMRKNLWNMPHHTDFIGVKLVTSSCWMCINKILFLFEFWQGSSFLAAKTWQVYRLQQWIMYHYTITLTRRIHNKDIIMMSRNLKIITNIATRQFNLYICLFCVFSIFILC